MNKSSLPQRSVNRGWRYPQPVRRFAERLFAQQLWCWGRDIQFLDANLLMEYGFRRQRQSRKRDDGSTCYRFENDSWQVVLWSFGAFYGRRECGGLFLHRVGFQQRWAPLEVLTAAIHCSHELPEFGRPRGQLQWDQAYRLCHELLGWIASYEGWVRRRVGLKYRRRCVSEWLRPFVSAEQMPAAWRLLQRRGWDIQPQDWIDAARRLELEL